MKNEILLVQPTTTAAEVAALPAICSTGDAMPKTPQRMGRVLNGRPVAGFPAKRNIYLTIDLDFWARRRVDMDFLRGVIRCVGAANVAAAVEHDSILPHARRYGNDCTILPNLDAHSDLGGKMPVAPKDVDGISDERRLELHSGSWVDYVAWPVRKEFVWVYPDFVSRKEGRCDAFSNHLPFSEIDCDWEQRRRQFAAPPDYGIDLSRVRALSVVLSPRFSHPDALEVFKALVREFDLELLDVLAADLAIMKPRPAPDGAAAAKDMPEDYGPLPIDANSKNIVPVKLSEDPKSHLNYAPRRINWREFPLREMLRGFCWPEAGVPPVGSLIRVEGAWYDLQSDTPEDGCQDRAKCPTKFWKVVSYQVRSEPEPDGPHYFFDAVGQGIEQYVVHNKLGAEGVARRLIGAA
jgi:hypothetical protein